MNTVHIFGSVAVVFVAAIAATVTGMQVSERADHVDMLEKQIRDDKARIQVLRTELAYLASPQRVQALVDLHRPDLGTPDSRQNVLNVSDMLPHQPLSSPLQAAVIQQSPRAEADRLIAMSVPKPARVPSRAIPAPRTEPESITQIIAAADVPEVRAQQPSAGLSRDLLATVQNIAAKDVSAQ